MGAIYIEDVCYSSGGGSGPSRLSDLSDTTITTPSNADLLVYDGSASKWVNVGFLTGTLLAGTTSLTISDNSITTNSVIQIFIDENFPNCYWETITTETGSVTITFNAQTADVPVKVRVL